MASESAIEPTRVMLWSVPRTLSTVIAKCMSFIEGSQVVIEPFNAAYHSGPEKVPLPMDLAVQIAPLEKLRQQRLQSVKIEGLQHAFNEEDVCTYAWVKDQLEAEYPGKSLVFCKGMAYGLQGKYDMLPKGYKHTFLIRHPHKVFLSWKKLLTPLAQMIFSSPEFRLCDLPAFMFPSKYGFEEQFELYQYIKANVDSSPVVIDADDILSNPKSVIRAYCREVGIPYTDDLLQWPSGLDAVKKWKASLRFLRANMLPTGGFLDAALHSTCFNPPKEIPPVSELPEDIIKCVQASMPFYQQLYEMRLKPEA